MKKMVTMRGGKMTGLEGNAESGTAAVLVRAEREEECDVEKSDQI